MIQNIDEAYRDIYRKHWKTINSQKIGVLKDIINFPVYSLDDNEFIKVLDTAKEKYGRIKLNISLGFILRNREDDEQKFFHPSNNNMLF